MGYNTRFTGELTFSRPLTYAELQEVAPAATSAGAVDFRLRHEEEQVETPEGRLTVIRAEAIEPIPGDEVRAYDAEAQLNALASRLPVDVALAGEIRGEGEAAGDVRRYVAESDHRVLELKPKLVWPDGHEEAPR